MELLTTATGGLDLGVVGSRATNPPGDGCMEPKSASRKLSPDPQYGSAEIVMERESSVGTDSIGVDKSGERVRRMFAEIAPRYDFLNHTLSLHVDRYWRWKALKILRLQPGQAVLDVCTGTGDLALSAAKQLGPETQVVGSDFCAEMLDFARIKQQRNLGDYPKLSFIEADTMHLPFAEASFQTVMVAFGLRNVSDTSAGLLEMLRVCKPGGTLAVLEFSKPSVPGLKQLYDFYFKSVLPRVGNSFAKNSSDAYRYLPQSVSEFPSGEGLAQVMRAAGWQDIQWHSMTLGAVTLYTGSKAA
jgi:demethylmenaquinone methyltransferase / 2-methoxy-6-polyprenyl-1,4-benzoquinol methylase